MLRFIVRLTSDTVLLIGIAALLKYSSNGETNTLLLALTIFVLSIALKVGD